MRTAEGGRGTPGYMAPEVYRPSLRTSSYAIDIFAFGMVLYEMMSGKYPFLELPTAEQIEDAVLRGDRPTLDTRWPSDLRRLMVDCWSQDPRRRPSITDVISRLTSAGVGPSPAAPVLTPSGTTIPRRRDPDRRTTIRKLAPRRAPSKYLAFLEKGLLGGLSLSIGDG